MIRLIYINQDFYKLKDYIINAQTHQIHLFGFRFLSTQITFFKATVKLTEQYISELVYPTHIVPHFWTSIPIIEKPLNNHTTPIYTLPHLNIPVIISQIQQQKNITVCRLEPKADLKTELIYFDKYTNCHWKAIFCTAELSKYKISYPKYGITRIPNFHCIKTIRCQTTNKDCKNYLQ